ncbi:jg20031 [Pararge aegeria aegeria]|uniref:Jg20031 protein n=1 Tax=Pararge aegeria aegeria TaxID=348720 RepID=A0A8S4R957_9NEOP|nr:jg20031 [Pararge aegeria aegeria]
MPQENKQCISLAACEKLKPLVKTDPVTLKTLICGYDKFLPKVCCPMPSITIVASESATCHKIEGKSKYSCVPLKSCRDIRNKYLRKTITVHDIEKLRCKGTDIINVCCENPKETDSLRPEKIPDLRYDLKPSVVPEDPFCGKEYSVIKSKINGGQNAHIYQYPWLVALIKDQGSVSVNFQCGGSLISDKHVLTAEHCTQTKKKMVVVLGEYNIANDGIDCIQLAGNNKVCTEAIEEIHIANIFKYGNKYRQRTSLPNDDIALIKLTRAVHFSKFIRPICLPSSDITKSPPEQLQLFAAGWGFMDTYATLKSDIKQYVSMPLVNHETCKLLYTLTEINETRICAGGESGQSTCMGDSGGPLIYKRDNVHELVGIASTGPKQCGLSRKPRLFVKSLLSYAVTPHAVDVLAKMYSLLKVVFKVAFVICIVHGQQDYFADLCFTPTQEEGQCISLDQCEELKPLISKSRENLKKYHCGWVETVPKVCCPSTITSSTKTTTTTTTVSPKPSGDCVTPEGKFGSCVPVQTCTYIKKMLATKTALSLEYFQRSRCIGGDLGSMNVCCDSKIRPSSEVVSRDGTCPDSAIPPNPESQCCGKESFTGNKVFGGNETAIDQYPWLALLQYTRPQLCGGSLISNKYVLTAAHCIINKSNKPRGVPICLPSSDITSAPPINMKLFVAGWGAVSEIRPFSEIKLYTSLPYVSHKRCQSDFNTLQGSLIWEKQICAGGELDKDTCKGDSGGPLMYENENVHEVIGVVSFGLLQCGIKKPSVYTKVYEYLSWINDNIKP